MNGELIYEAMGCIGCDLVEEAQLYRDGKSAWKRTAALAACLAAMVCLAVIALPAAQPAALSGWIDDVLHRKTLDPALWESAPFYFAGLVLGVIAWALPVWGLLTCCRGRQWLMAGSMTACVLAVFLQLAALGRQVMWERWEAMWDAMDFVTAASCVVVLGTVALNAQLLRGEMRREGKLPPMAAKVWLLLMVLISAAHYYDVGRWKAIVRLFGVAEFLVAAPAVVLVAGGKKTGENALFRINLLLTVMQLCPLGGAVLLGRWNYVCYHLICIAVGVLALRRSGKGGADV